MGAIICTAECGACGETRHWGRWGAEPWMVEGDRAGDAREGDALLFCTSCGCEDLLPEDYPGLHPPWREGAKRLGVGLLLALPAAIVVGLLIAPVDVWWKLQWGILLVLAGFFVGSTLSSMLEYVLWRIMPRALDATPCPRCDGALRWPEEARGKIPCPRCGARGFAVSLEFHR